MIQPNFTLPFDILCNVLRIILHFSHSIWWQFLLPHLQKTDHYFPHQCSAELHTSKRILLISLVAEATFSFHSHFDVTRLLSPSILSSGRFSQVRQFFIRQSWFIDFLRRRLPSADTAKLRVIWPHLDVFRCPPTEFCYCETYFWRISTLGNVWNITYFNPLVTICNSNWSFFLLPSLGYAPRWVLLCRWKSLSCKPACLSRFPRNIPYHYAFIYRNICIWVSRILPPLLHRLFRNIVACCYLFFGEGFLWDLLLPSRVRRIPVHFAFASDVCTVITLSFSVFCFRSP